MGKQERREKSRQEMREVILEAARRLFYSEGFSKTTLRGIARAIGYTPGAIYSYYKDKNAILYDLHNEGFARLAASMVAAAPPDSPPHERLARCGGAYLEFAFANTEFYDLMFIQNCLGDLIEEHGEDDPGIGAFRFLEGIIGDCIRAGALPEHDPVAASMAFWGAVHGLVALVLRRRCVMVPEDQVKDVVFSATRFILEATLREPGPARAEG